MLHEIDGRLEAVQYRYEVTYLTLAVDGLRVDYGTSIRVIFRASTQTKRMDPGLSIHHP